jgi:hypothetical protein
MQRLVVAVSFIKSMGFSGHNTTCLIGHVSSVAIG